MPGSGVEAETIATGRPVETSRKNGAINVLLGHVIATKTTDPTATDNSMGVPEDWNSPTPKPTNLGHKEAGRTIVLSSVGILPGFQGRGLGRVLMMCYMQNMNGAGIADRLALIAHDVSIFLSKYRVVINVRSTRYRGTRSSASLTKVQVKFSLVVEVGMIW